MINTQSEVEFVEKFKKFLKKNGVKIKFFAGSIYFSNGQDGEREIWFEVSDILNEKEEYVEELFDVIKRSEQ